MLSIVRRSQLQGVIAMDGSTISHLGEIETVWLDQTGDVVYLAGSVGYLPLHQVANISPQAVSTYGRMIMDAPAHLQSLDQLEVQLATGEPVGWVEDFLFDWHTGKVMAYILAGAIADSLGEQAVLYPEDVEHITVDYLMLRDDAPAHLVPVSKGLRGFVSEKSQQVQHLVKVISDRVHHLITPHDHPDVVRVRVKDVSEEMAASGEHDHNALQEATAYLHEQWEHLHQMIQQSKNRSQSALDAAWKYLTGQSSSGE